MKLEELKEYLQTVTDMEKECYLQDKLSADLRQRIARLGHPSFLERPQQGDPTSGAGSVLFVGAMLGAIVGAVVGLFSSNIGGGAGIGLVIGLILGVGLLISEESRSNKEYEEKFKVYEQALSKDTKRIQAEQRVIVLLTQELTAVEQKNADTHELLQSLYAKDIIFPKYRNFVMISSIYEYFCSGRCTTLEGHEGAYNILESEIRLNHVISQLDEVLVKLDDIINNQYVIYCAIQETNQKIDEIIESNRQIEGTVRQLKEQGDELNARVANLQLTSGLNLYFNELTQKELAYRNQWGV